MSGRYRLEPLGSAIRFTGPSLDYRIQLGRHGAIPPEEALQLLEFAYQAGLNDGARIRDQVRERFRGLLSKLDDALALFEPTKVTPDVALEQAEQEGATDA